MRTNLKVVIVLTVAALSAWAGGDPLDAAFNTFGPGPASMPVQWGRPLDGGPIRTVFIVPRFAATDAVSLGERIELDSCIAPVWRSHHFAEPAGAGWHVPAATQAETERRMLEALRGSPDLIVVANIDLRILPDTVIATLLRRIRDGAGLVLAHCRPGKPPAFRVFLDAVEPAESLSEDFWGHPEDYMIEWPGGLGAIRAGTAGASRVVEFQFPQPYPAHHSLTPSLGDKLFAEAEYLDSYYSIVAKAMRWAAHREPRVRIAATEPEVRARPDRDLIPPSLSIISSEQIQRALHRQPWRQYRVRLDGPADKTYTVRWQVRRPGQDWKSTFSYGPKTAALSEGIDACSIYVPEGSGEYLLDVWLLDKDNVVDWYTRTILFPPRPDILKVIFSKKVLSSHDSLAITVELAPLPEDTITTSVAEQQTGQFQTLVYARARDSFGRVVSHTCRKAPDTGGAVELHLALTDLLSPRLEVEVFALHSLESVPTDQNLSKAISVRAHFPVRRPHAPSRFGLTVLAAGSDEFNARTSYTALASAGVDSAYAFGVPDGALNMAESGLLPICEVLRLAPQPGQDPNVHLPCLTDPASTRRKASHLRAKVKFSRAVGTSWFSIGAGNCLATGKQNVCQSTTCLDGFRSWLRTEYGTLDRLNTVWQTEFATWDHVAPAPEGAAIALGVYPPWIDFRTYMDGAFADAHASARDTIRHLCDGAQVGFRARVGGSAYDGYDWGRLARPMDWLAVPPQFLDVEKVRSYRGPNGSTSLAPSSALDSDDPGAWRWHLWYALLHDFSGLWWPQAVASARGVFPTTGVGPGGLVLPGFRELVEEVEQARSGLDALLLTAERDNCGIAIYSNQPSRYLNHLDRTYALDSARAETAIARLLEDLGYQYDFVSADQAARGELMAYRLVLLPMVRALSEDEVAAIRTFHDSGGHIFADVLPAEFDQHGSPRTASPLAGLFGVRHIGPGIVDPAVPPMTSKEPGSGHEVLVQLPFGEDTVTASLGRVTGNPSIQPVGASPGGTAGDAPIWLVHRNGPATAFLLNHGLPAYRPHSIRPNAIALRRLFGALLAEAGLEPAVQTTPSQDEPFHGERVAYRYGEARIVALLADLDAPERPQRVRVGLGDRRRVYDLMHRRRVGETRHIGVALPPGQAALFATLPYRVKGLRIEAPEDVQAGGRLRIQLEVVAKKANPGIHLVHVELIPLTGPRAGQSLRHYTQNVECPGGQGDTYIPLALNDVPGPYRIVARDVLTGASARTKVRLTPPMTVGPS